MPKKGFKSITISEELFIEIKEIQKRERYKNKADVISTAIQLLSEKLESKKNMKKQTCKNHSHLKTCLWCEKIHTGKYDLCEDCRTKVVEECNTPSARGE